MVDTQFLRFSLKENATIFTNKLTDDDPGEQILKFTASPMESMLQKVTASSTTTWYTNALGLTISRWREIKYIGTQIAFKPLATNGSVDPAHIQQTAASDITASYVQGAINPYDSNNHIHWRRWLGGNINVPNEGDIGGIAINALKLDNTWLQDDRFNHANVNEGFETFVAPLRAKVTAGAPIADSLFGFYSIQSGSAYDNTRPWTPADGDTDSVQSRTISALTGSLDDVTEMGWLPNPMAGLKYTMSGIEPGYEAITPSVTVSGVNNKFPWYGDLRDLASGTSGHIPGVNVICEMIIERFMSPLLIVRLPPAYSTVYGWRIYISHNFAVRKPFMTSSAWEISKISQQLPVPIIRAEVSKDKNEKPEYRMDEKPIRIIQALNPDPYADTEWPNTISMGNGMKYFGRMWGREPRNPGEPLMLPEKTDDQEPESGGIDE